MFVNALTTQELFLELGKLGGFYLFFIKENVLGTKKRFGKTTSDHYQRSTIYDGRDQHDN